MKIQRSVCSACGFAGGPQKNVPGSFAVEFILWCFFAVPGLIYSVWRLSSVRGVCPSCTRDAMIPYPSPRATELLAGRGGWLQPAEQHYVDTAKREWRRLVGWSAFSWVWVAAWAAAGASIPAWISGIIAAALTATTLLGFPRASR